MDNNPTLGTDDTPRLPDVAWTNFHSWAEVGAWYRSVEGSRTDPSDDVRARVATLIAGKSTPDEKARAIYAYVSNQIRYIGVAFGVGRYQPHEAADVLSNQYGDCKDKATLLASMLSAAGIPTDTVLVGAGITFNDAVPSPGSFNHAISLAHIDGKPVWLDSTSEVAPFGLLSFSIRDHKALVVPLTGDAHVETTPRDSPVPEGSNFEAVGTLDEHGTSHSHMVLDLHGDEEVPFRQAVRSVSTAQWDELMQRISQNLSFAGKVTNTQFSRADDTSVPVHITYDYEREKSGDWDTLRILAQMPPAGFPDVDEKDPPVTPIELGIPQVETAHASMTLPKGWTADLPASVHMKSSFATVDTTYKLQNGALITDRRIEILKKNIPASDWKSYQQWIKDAGLVNENYIQLVENSAAIGSTSTLTVNSGNRAAADLIREATQDEQRKDWAAATAKLDAAKAINPHQPFLDSNYGYVAVHTGKVAKGIADYKREITAHPDEDYVFQLLAAAQFPADPTAAIATLQAAVARNPSFEQNVLYLSFILVRRGEYADAEKVLRAGLASKPDELVLKLRLGTVLFHQHKNAEAEPLLKAVIEASKDPGQLNDAAYELANASVDLPLADKTARQALDLLDTATNNGETGPAALRRASLLVSTWDTLGWILYREDKIAEAEPWIRAAWRNGNGAEPGYHLGILLEEQKQPAAALGIYLLANSGQPGIDDIAVHKLLADKIATLRAAGLPDPAKNPALDLQNQRTYEVPHDTLQASGESWATIELYVTPQGTTDFNIVQGDQSLQPLSDAIQHLNLDLQLPPATHAKLVRRGVLSCHSSKLCQLVLIPTGDAPNS
jgi:tetratricopeptide (TPR) repeat protein